MTLLQELDRTIRLLEADLPAQPDAPQNVRLANGLERELARYFKALEDAMPWDDIEAIYYRNVGITESNRPTKPTIESLVEVASPIIIQGPPGEKGEQGDKGDAGGRGEQGLPGSKGDSGLRGEQGIQGEQGTKGDSGERGEKGLAGEKGQRGEKGQQGDTGDSGLSKKQQDDIKGIIDDFSGKEFVEKDDPRLKDAREPKSHKHPEIQTMIYAPSIAAGILSNPPSGKYKVINLFVEPDTEKLTVEYEKP